MADVRRRIFVVDDEPVIAMTLASILCREGYDARPFFDPQEALNAFRQECPDLLLSDVMMPGLTGVELALRVRGMCPVCRILLISGAAATIDLLEPAREHGQNFRLLNKPIAPLRLIAQIDESFQKTA